MTHPLQAGAAGLLLVLLLAACGGRDEDGRLTAPLAVAPTPSSPSPSTAAEPTAEASTEPTGDPSTSPTSRASSTPTPAAPQRCAHPTEGYAVTFPADWHVEQRPDIEPCTFFDPRPLALEPGTEADGVAVRLDVLDAPLPEARRALEEDGMRVTSEEAVDRRAALRPSPARHLPGARSARRLSRSHVMWSVELRRVVRLPFADDSQNGLALAALPLAHLVRDAARSDGPCADRGAGGIRPVKPQTA